MRKKVRSKNLKLLLVLLLMVITVGYATLTTNLTINGTSKINNSTWDVHFETVTITPGSVTIDTNDNTQYAARVDSNDTTKVEFSVLFNEPGDFYEFTVKAVNDGSIDAMIDSVSKTLKINGTTQDSIPAWLNYTVTYSDGEAIAKNHMLEHSKFETYKVRVEFKKDITNEQFNEARGKTLTFEYDVDYIQKGEGATPVNHTTTLYGVYNNSSIILNQPVPSTVTLRNTAAEAMNDWIGLDDGYGAMDEKKPYYLKHVISNGVVTESYIEIVIDDDYLERDRNDFIYNCENDNDCINSYVAPNEGIYTLRGGVNESSLTDKPVFDSNLAVLRNMYGDAFDTYCQSYGGGYECSASYNNLKYGSYRIGIDMFGSVSVLGLWVCLANDYSYCYYDY